MNKKRRRLLKAGLIAGCAGGWPQASGSNLPSVPLLKGLRTRLWIEHASTYRRTPPAPSIPALASDVDQSPLLFWIEKNLQLVRKYQLNPLRAARTFSYLAVAMHDVMASCGMRFAGSAAHGAAGMHFAAGCMLEYLFPEETRGRWVGEGIFRASRYADAVNNDWEGIWFLADNVARKVIDHALTDGSARVNALVQPPKHIQFAWKAAPPLWSSRPVEPGAPHWRPWLVPSSIGMECPPPATLNEKKYLEEIQLVYQTHHQLTPLQKKIAEDWNLDLGTVTPPGVWLMKATENISFQQLGLHDQVSAISLLAATMLDAFSACWYVKFKWWTERPVTAIRRLYEPEFMPHVLTPSFPSYVSGHATVSGAAATILSHVLPKHRIEWKKAAQEASDSRLYGGIHFRFDNEEGLRLGEKVATRAVEQLRHGKRATL